ncbi:MAG: coenzyme F420-0:L-glutamate ligase [Patescibacteria group bacterium]|nr:coenzyme F420-0:L-glutamate ligase [Patescibacteria group bacterium]
MNIRAIKTHVFEEGDDLAAFVRAHVKKIPEQSVLVVASKIAALAESRVVRGPGLGQKEYAGLVRRESSAALKTKYAWLTVKDGMLMANAGIDASNADDGLVLLPKDSFRAAARLRAALKKIYRVKKIGVIIADSHVEPLRAGVVAHALGYAGIQGVRDYRGTKDLFGRRMKISRTNVADSLATAAALVMGEGAERQPLAIVTDAPVAFAERINKKETRIAPKDDLYWPLLKNLFKK